jgi:hypothetical protein
LVRVQRARRRVGALVIGLIASVGVAAPAAASPATERCVLVAQRADESTKTIPLKEVCGSEAASQLRANESTLLARLHEHADYGGYNAEVYGEYGTCDREGYSLRMDRYWMLNLSSYEVFGQCYWSTVTNRASDVRYGAIGNQRYVGDQWNDDVVRLRIWAR